MIYTDTCHKENLNSISTFNLIEFRLIQTNTRADTISDWQLIFVIKNRWLMTDTFHFNGYYHRLLPSTVDRRYTFLFQNYPITLCSFGVHSRIISKQIINKILPFMMSEDRFYDVWHFIVSKIKKHTTNINLGF